MSDDDLHPRSLPRHRCQPLHTVYGLVALLAGAGLLLEQPVMAVFAGPLAVVVHSMHLLLRGDTRSPESAASIGALARRAWLAAAAGLDLLLVVGVFTVCTVLLHGDSGILVLRGRTADYLALSLGIVFIAAHAFTHRMAARSAGPRPDDS